MSFFRLYRRVIALLRPEARIAIVLVLANIVLAAAQFAEPVLFGRVIDRLTSGAASRVLPTLGSLSPLIAAWVGFALTSITLAMFVSLQADRMAHRQRLSVIARYFEHVLHLPLSFHAKTHSGRSLKVMIESANGLFMIYLTFFRESLAALVATLVLLPLSLVLNWRLGLLLMGLMLVFFGLIAFVRRRTEVLQTSVERFNSSLAERVSDALGNVPVIQSFTRIESEASAMRGLSQNVLRAQLPVLTWWAMAVVGSKAAATVTLLLIFVFGTSLYLRGLGTIGEIVMFMNFAAMLIGRLEQLANLFNMLFLQAPRLSEYFDVLDMVPNRGGNAWRARSRTAAGARAVRGCRFHLSGLGAAGRIESRFHRRARPDRGLGWRDGVREIDDAVAAPPRLRSQCRPDHHRWRGYPRDAARCATPEHRRGVSGADVVCPLDPGESRHRQTQRQRGGNRPCARPRASQRFRGMSNRCPAN